MKAVIFGGFELEKVLKLSYSIKKKNPVTEELITVVNGFGDRNGLMVFWDSYMGT